MGGHVGAVENYTKLLKLLYLADRASILETGSPITGSSFVCMTHGPVLSEVYECIKGEPVNSVWDQHLKRSEQWDLTLARDPGDSELSDYDVNLLEGLRAKHASHGYGAMIDIVHKLSEWKDPAPSKVAALPASRILEQAGVSAAEICELAKSHAYMAAVDSMLAH